MDQTYSYFLPYNAGMADHHDPYVDRPFGYVGQPQPLIYPNDNLMMTMMMIPDHHYYMQPSYYMDDPYNSRSGGVWINSSDHHPSMYGTLVDEATLIAEPPTYTGFVQLVDGLVQVVNFDEMEDQQVLGGRDYYYYDDLFEIDEQMRVVSYEDLLEMEERVGRVNVGLSEETISKHLKTSSSDSAAACCSRVDDHSKESAEEGAEICVVCQYEYESNETVGSLQCGHRYHADCIKEWLLQHNVCPICKSTALQV